MKTAAFTLYLLLIAHPNMEDDNIVGRFESLEQCIATAKSLSDLQKLLTSEPRYKFACAGPVEEDATKRDI